MATRDPFDPSRVRVTANELPFGTREGALTVRQVNELVRGTLGRHLPPTLHVVGEIGDFSRPASGHVYLTLKDSTSELRAVIWRSVAAKILFALHEGLEVVATGAIEVYAPRGTYQLIIRRVEPRGIGALELAFRQLKDRLEREGLFDARRKKPIPRFPGRVGIVTSPSGAAIRDILQTFRRRFPAIDVLIHPVRVQGEGAAAEIAAAIGRLNAWNDELGGIDVLIVARGGGSLEDLWAFNEELVARAIAASEIPVVSGVGHEVDVTISDLVADLRAPTPTAAAELTTPDQAELLARVDHAAQRSVRAIRQLISLCRARLSELTSCDGISRPTNRLRERVQLVDELLSRLRYALAEAFREAGRKLQGTQTAVVRFGSGARFAESRHGLERALNRLDRMMAAEYLIRERALRCDQERIARFNPEHRIEAVRQRIATCLGRCVTAARWRISAERRVHAARIAEVAACAPPRVLERGYSITRDAKTRRIIRSREEVSDGTRLSIEMRDGEFKAVAEDPRQPGLFD